MFKKIIPIIAVGLLLLVISVVGATDYTTAVPLPELATDTYLGQQGGLYPQGLNLPPVEYLAELDAVANQLGNDNQVVIVAIGPSIMQNSVNGFMPFLSSPEVNNNIVFVDGTLGSNQQRFVDPDYFGWNTAVTRLAAVGLAPADVDVVFYYNALTSPSGSFADFVQVAADSFGITYGIISDKYPNTKIVLHSSQHYAGWCGQCKAPEPYAYYNGFAVKELIERRINDEISGPLLAWNAYQWNDAWPSSYFSDGLHLSGAGQQATGQLWHDYLSSTSFTASWYLDAPIATPTPSATPLPTATGTITPTDTPTVPVVTVTATATPSPFQTATPIGSPTITPSRGGTCGRSCQTATAAAP